MALSPLRDGERIMGASIPSGTRGFGEFQPGLERESVPFSFLIHTKLNIYEHASLKMGNSAAHSVFFPCGKCKVLIRGKGFIHVKGTWCLTGFLPATEGQLLPSWCLRLFWKGNAHWCSSQHRYG